MEEYSKTKRLLLLLRQYTSRITADLILDLLSENRFLDFTGKELESMIKAIHVEE